MMMRNYLIGTQLPLTARRYNLVGVTRYKHRAETWYPAPAEIERGGAPLCGINSSTNRSEAELGEVDERSEEIPQCGAKSRPAGKKCDKLNEYTVRGRCS